MEVRALKTLNRNDGHTVYAGMKFNTSPDEGARLCKDGLAEPVAVKPQERAEKRPGSRRGRSEQR